MRRRRRGERKGGSNLGAPGSPRQDRLKNPQSIAADGEVSSLLGDEMRPGVHRQEEGEGLPNRLIFGIGNLRPYGLLIGLRPGCVEVALYDNAVK